MAKKRGFSEENKKNIEIIAIVAIVAIVAIFVLFLQNNDGNCFKHKGKFDKSLMKEKFLNKGIAETDDVAKAAVEEVAQEVTQPSTGSIITGAVIADIEDLPPIVKGPPTEFLPDPNNR